MEQQYKVVFRGTKKSGAEEEQIKHRVSKLLRISHAACDNLFNASDEVVMKRRVDLPGAEKLQQLFAKVGVYCEILPCNPLGLNQTPAPISNLFVCRYCKFQQNLAAKERSPERCPDCNTITDEYKADINSSLESERIKERLKEIGKQESTDHNIKSTLFAKNLLTRGKVIILGC